jgi:phage host-nuclease inhibitor protein Gam
MTPAPDPSPTDHRGPPVTASDPSASELLRRIEDVVRSVERLASTMEASYVRREVYEAKHEALRREVHSSVKDVADDIAEAKRLREKDADRWKQAMFTIGVAIVLLLIQGALTVSNFMARVGGPS